MIFARVYGKRYFSFPDVAILFLLATVIYGIVAFAHAWRTEYSPVTQIDLSVWALPYYTLLSAIRGVIAYSISLLFSLVVGYTAAKSRAAEKVIIPLLDICQSIPVLGFLPGLVLALVTLFPHSNFGIELAAIIMIFTGQVWNMTFSFYSSLKSIPSELREAATVMKLGHRDTLMKLELPFSAVNLAWNSLLSMAGGWFFLNVCEAFTLGEMEFRLPGIGAYMDLAVKTGDRHAIGMAIVAMVSLIVLMDFLIWRSILAWVKKFRLEDLPGSAPVEPLMQIWIRESVILTYIREGGRRLRSRWFRSPVRRRIYFSVHSFERSRSVLCVTRIMVRLRDLLRALLSSLAVSRIVWGAAWVCMGLGIGYGAFKLVVILIQIPGATWVLLMRDTLFTFGRVFFALVLGTLLAVPLGIWIGISQKRTQVAQPLIQVLASFPAPMLFPLALEILFWAGVPLGVASVFLIFLGVQWYLLFNVLAGALRIPKNLRDALELMESSSWDRWKSLYLPSIFPSLVTGWMTAAGAAWNASIVAEYVHYRGGLLKTVGLGASLSSATAQNDFPLFAASLTLMVVLVIVLNRLVWSPLCNLVQSRFRME